MIKNLLTLEQLVNYIENNNLSKFSSNDFGYTLSVQIPGELTFSKVDNTEDLLFVKIKTSHYGLNRNNSFMSEETAKKAMPSLKYRPVLASIITNENGELDFNAHDAEMYKDEDGVDQIRYIEKQVGAFTNEDPYFEYDEKTDKTYIVANAAIPRNYTEAAEILERKGGTKVSAELAIREMAYNSKEKYLELKDVYYSGVTLLGDHIEEGMLGSKLELQDFSSNNNSVKFELNDEISKMINNAVKSAVDNYINSQKGGNEMQEDNMELQQEDTSSETEIVEKESQESEIQEPEITENDSENTSEFENDAETENNQDLNAVTYSVNGKTFEISLDDINYALNTLVNDTYAEADNDWYAVTVYESSVVMQSFITGKAYRQKFKKRSGCYSLTGDRVEVFANWLTADEELAIENLRASYSSIESELAKYKEAEEIADKMTVFNDESYAQFLDSTEFKSLMEEETLKKFTKQEIIDQAEIAFAKIVKKSGTFAKQSDDSVKNVQKVIGFSKEKNSSFLDMLLKKK